MVGVQKGEGLAVAPEELFCLVLSVSLDVLELFNLAPLARMLREICGRQEAGSARETLSAGRMAKNREFRIPYEELKLR